MTQHDTAFSYETQIISFLQDLIRIPSFSGNEKAVVERIAEEMHALHVYDSVITDRMGNVIGTWGEGPCVIMLDGHIDVVGVGDINAWTRQPFAAEIEDGYMYGRGATDEKPGPACMTYAPLLLDESLKKLVTVVVVGSVMEEDCDGYPLSHIITQEGIQTNYVVLGEPTDMYLYHGHRGRMELTIHVDGIAAHGAHCDRGDNAIYKMAHIIRDIEKLHTHLPSHDILGKGSVTISRIESRSPSLCSVADGCTIYLDRRMTVGENKETVCAELNALPSVQKYNAIVSIREYKGTSWTGMSVEKDCYFPTWILDENNELVTAASLAIEKVTGEKAKRGVWTFSTNGVATMGELGIPTIGFAPGKEELAHSIHERVACKELPIATAVYAEIIQQLAKSN